MGIMIEKNIDTNVIDVCIYFSWLWFKLINILYMRKIEMKENTSFSCR